MSIQPASLLCWPFAGVGRKPFRFDILSKARDECRLGFPPGSPNRLKQQGKPLQLATGVMKPVLLRISSNIFGQVSQAMPWAEGAQGNRREVFVFIKLLLEGISSWNPRVKSQGAELPTWYLCRHDQGLQPATTTAKPSAPWHHATWPGLRSLGGRPAGIAIRRNFRCCRTSCEEPAAAQPGKCRRLGVPPVQSCCLSLGAQ